jgi:hypothetical protein
MTGKYLRGAFVQFLPTFLIPIPNVIVFQYNPETMRHGWSPAPSPDEEERKGGNPLAVTGVPGEKFSFKLVLDAYQSIADGKASGALADKFGVATRLAALEMLMFPTGAGGGLTANLELSIGPGGLDFAASIGVEPVRIVPEAQLPTVLFVWGAGRILPVKVTGLSVDETLYDAILNPIHAEVDVELEVLTPDELAHMDGPLKELAKVAYDYTSAARQVLAVANLANSAESVVGMLPL